MTATLLRKATLSFGSQGKAVEELQELLNRYHYGLPVDGIFGSWTEGCVKDFQLTHFLSNDGIVGDQTWRALYAGAPVDMPVLRRSSTGETVKLVQNILSLLVKDHLQHEPYYIGQVDGLYGQATENAVKAFQQNSGLPTDGTMGDRTWHALSKHGYLLYYV
ncbi:MAG: peptidoglycan-binding protein [Cyanobacteria bacterium J06632_22]